MVRTVLLWKSRIRAPVVASYRCERRCRPSPMTATMRLPSSQTGRRSCWISRVSRVTSACRGGRICAPFGVVLDTALVSITYSSQSSFGIIWKAIRDPSGESAGASMRCVPIQTTVGDPPPIGATRSRDSDIAMEVLPWTTACDSIHAMVEPSAETVGARPSMRRDVLACRSMTENAPAVRSPAAPVGRRTGLPASDAVSRYRPPGSTTGTPLKPGDGATSPCTANPAPVRSARRIWLRVASPASVATMKIVFSFTPNVTPLGFHPSSPVIARSRPVATSRRPSGTRLMVVG